MQYLRHLYNKYKYLATIQNAGLVLAGIIALSWVWGAVSTLQKNYAYQREVDANAHQIEMMKLQNQNYQYMQAYYKSEEYQELSVRQKLGLAKPGERLVILPSSEGIVDTAAETSDAAAKPVVEESNFSKWMQLLFGKRASVHPTNPEQLTRK